MIAVREKLTRSDVLFRLSTFARQAHVVPLDADVRALLLPCRLGLHVQSKRMACKTVPMTVGIAWGLG